MAKSNDQIRREYAATPFLQRQLQDLGDLANITVNGATGGLFNRAAQAASGATDEQRADYEAETRTRAGLVGDVANVAGMLAGLKGAGAAVKGAAGAVRAAPAAAELAGTAGPLAALRYATGTAGAGLVPVAAREGARLSGRALAKGAGALGLLGLSIAGRQDGNVVAPAVPAEPATNSQAVGQALTSGGQAAINPTTARALGVVDQILSRPHTLRAAQAAVGLLPAPLKPQTARDAVFGTASNALDAQAQLNLANADKIAEGPERDQARAAALDAYIRDLLQLAGADPTKRAAAEAIGGAE